MLNNVAWIIGGTSAASAAVVGGIAYNVYVRNPEQPVTPKQPVSSSEPQKIAALPAKSLPAKSVPAKSVPTKPLPVQKTLQAKPAQPEKQPAKAASGNVAADKRPSFDIVRVEPTGDSIVAGRSEPNAIVELLNQGKPFAKAKADANGQFVIIPKTLKPGAHQLQLRARVKGKISESKQAVAVSVPQQGGKRKAKEVIVALAEPGKPTKILSDTARPVPAKAVVPVNKTAASAVEKPPVKPLPAQAVGDATQQKKRGEPAPAQVAALPVRPEAAKAARPVAQQAPVRIRIVEAEENGGFYVSGFSNPGSRIRLYLNGSFIAQVQSGKTGSWSLRVGRGMSAGNYSVRADGVDPRTNKVLSRAQVPFNYPVRVAAAKTPKKPAVETPATTAPVKIAASKAAASKAAAAMPDNSPSPEAHILAAAGPKKRLPARIAAPPSARTSEQKNASTPAADASRKIAGLETAPVKTAAVKTVQIKSAEAKPAEIKTAAVKPAPAKPAPVKAPLPAARKAQQPAAGPLAGRRAQARPAQTKQVQEKQSPAKQRPARQAALKSAANQSSSNILPPPEPAAHIVIERLTTANVTKGDSLWRISRKIFGRGIRYTQIYAANSDQIRNPHKIWPGQVFVVPLGAAGGKQTASGKPSAVQ